MENINVMPDVVRYTLATSPSELGEWKSWGVSIGIPIEKAKKDKQHIEFLIYFRPAGQPDGKTGKLLQNGRGAIGKPILEFLTFGSIGIPYRKGGFLNIF